MVQKEDLASKSGFLQKWKLIGFSYAVDKLATVCKRAFYVFAVFIDRDLNICCLFLQRGKDEVAYFAICDSVRV